MTGKNSATERMIGHLEGIARRVADCAGDVEAVRAVIEDYSRLDESTRRVEAETIPSSTPPGEWVLAEGCRDDHRMLYLHGGSWMSGSPDGYRPLAARIGACTRYQVFVPDYRLAPEHPFPAGLEDCAAALAWLAGHQPGGESPARRLLVAGDSAGGNLALATALKGLDESGPPLDGVIALSPAVDLTWQSRSLKTRAKLDPVLRPDRLQLVSEAYVQGAERLDHPYVSPVFGDFSGLSRALIQVGDREVLLDDARRISARMESQGVGVDLQIYPDMPHVFQVFAPAVPAARDAVDRIGEFVRRLD